MIMMRLQFTTLTMMEIWKWMYNYKYKIIDEQEDDKIIESDNMDAYTNAEIYLPIWTYK
jgi:hypothetical protein